MALLSNSAGLAQYDPDGEEAAALEAALGVAVIRHASKKPGGAPGALAAHFGIPPSSVPSLVMVGDRYLTDVVYGNRLGLLTVRPAPVTAEGEPRAVRLVSFLFCFLFFKYEKGGGGRGGGAHPLPFRRGTRHGQQRTHSSPLKKKKKKKNNPGAPCGGRPRPAVDGPGPDRAAAPAGADGGRAEEVCEVKVEMVGWGVGMGVGCVCVGGREVDSACIFWAPTVSSVGGGKWRVENGEDKRTVCPLKEKSPLTLTSSTSPRAPPPPLPSIHLSLSPLTRHALPRPHPLPGRPAAGCHGCSAR